MVSGGNNPETPVPNLIVFFVLLGWMVSIPELTDSSDSKNATVLPALAFSILFCFQGANALGIYPKGELIPTP